MKKIFLVFLMLSLSLIAEVINQPLDKNLVNSCIPIVDIRTPGEWKETGIIKGSIPIMFFDERGNYDVRGFLQELNNKVDTQKKFALICRSGSRTGMVSAFLSQKLGYSVINLVGGINTTLDKKYLLEPYKGH